MAIPAFPDFAPVELAHKDDFDRVLRTMERPISEWSFANLYLFRLVHDYRVSRLNGFLLITSRGYDGKRYGFMPWGPSDPSPAAKILSLHLLQNGGEGIIYPVTANAHGRYFDGGGWVGETDRDGADYVYLTENLANLPGPAYHKKKNRLMKYLREIGGEYSYSRLEEENVDACIELARGWCGERCSIDRPSTFAETDAAVEALLMRRELGLTGGVFMVGKQIEAYCLGEPLNEDTFVVHFEKALPGRDGAAQAINREFCKNGISAYRFVNREQDLGDPGLRQAKEGYRPLYLTEKFRLRLTGQP